MSFKIFIPFFVFHVVSFTAVQAAPGQCVSVRCFNTVPTACCPASNLGNIANSLKATREQVMTLPLETLEIGALLQSCSYNCSNLVFGNYVEGCLRSQGFMTASLEQVYYSNNSLCNAYCAFQAYANNTDYGATYSLTDLWNLTTCGGNDGNATETGNASCNSNCTQALSVPSDTCRGRLIGVTTYGLGARLRDAYTACNVSFDASDPLGPAAILSSNAGGRKLLSTGLLAAVAGAGLLLSSLL